MYHKKTYNSETMTVNETPLYIEGPVTKQLIEEFAFHEGLKAFRPPNEQKEALKEIADLPEGRIIVARTDDMIVGYVTFLHPDPLERWSQGNMPDLLELGAIELAAPYRGAGVSKTMLKVAFMDDAMNDYIVITTEYYWHWDLKGTGLNVWEYRKMMEKMMGSAGLQWFATDDPEICSHPANCLMAKIGTRIPMESIQKFDSLRFQNRWTY